MVNDSWVDDVPFKFTSWLWSGVLDRNPFSWIWRIKYNLDKIKHSSNISFIHLSKVKQDNT